MEAEKVEFPNKEEWRKFRKSGIGGSNSANILGVGWKSTLDEWAWFRGLVEDEPDTERMWWGTKNEPNIREAYGRQTGRTVEDQGIHTFVNRKHDFIRYSADGLIIPEVHLHLPHMIFEAKCTGYLTVKDLEEDFPLAWEVQVQHGLFTLGLQKASVAVLVNGNKLLWKDIERNDSFIEQMIEKEREFWNMVLTGTPPEADYRESTKDTISKLYPRDTGATVQLPPEAMNWAEQLFDAKAKIKVHEKIRDEQENKLKMAIGDNTFGTLPNGSSFSWKWQERTIADAEKAKAAGFMKTSEFRVLRRKGK